MPVKHINKDEFTREVLESDKKVLVDFYAEWCGPCKMMAPVLEKISEDNNSVIIVKINVDESPELAEKYNVMSIPAFFLFEKGNVINKTVGAMSEKEMMDFIGI